MKTILFLLLVISFTFSFPLWDTTTLYTNGDIVEYSTYNYSAINNPPVGNPPNIDGTSGFYWVSYTDTTTDTTSVINQDNVDSFAGGVYIMILFAVAGLTFGLQRTIINTLYQ